MALVPEDASSGTAPGAHPGWAARLRPWRARAGAALVAARRGVRLVLVVLLIGLLPFLALAGGKGISAAAGIVGLGAIALTLTKPPEARARLEPWFWALLAFAVFAAASSLWSRHPVEGGFRDVLFASKPALLVWGIPVYTAAAQAVLSVAARHPAALRHLGLASVVLAAGLGLVDSGLGYGVSFAVDPLQSGESLHDRLADAVMNSSHALSVSAVLAVPAALGLWEVVRPTSRGLGAATGALLVAGVGVAAALAGFHVALLALLVAALFAAAAWLWPRAGAGAAFGLAGASLLLAPLLAQAARAAAGIGPNLPFSWEHRMAGWAYVAERIAERPLWGHGFGASRTFDATVDMRGFEMSLVSVHPHNAGLQLWLETGAVGVALAVLALVALARRALEWADGERVASAGLAALVGAVSVFSAVAVSAWHEWWWAFVFLAASLLAVVLGRADGARA